jgi:hypothetical protein
MVKKSRHSRHSRQSKQRRTRVKRNALHTHKGGNKCDTILGYNSTFNSSNPGKLDNFIKSLTKEQIKSILDDKECILSDFAIDKLLEKFDNSTNNKQTYANNTKLLKRNNGTRFRRMREEKERKKAFVSLVSNLVDRLSKGHNFLESNNNSTSSLKMNISNYLRVPKHKEQMIEYILKGIKLFKEQNLEVSNEFIIENVGAFFSNNNPLTIQTEEQPRLSRIVHKSLNNSAAVDLNKLSTSIFYYLLEKLPESQSNN